MVWLNDQSPTLPVCPLITKSLHDGYVMERCIEPDIWETLSARAQYLRLMKQVLKARVWCHGPKDPTNVRWADTLRGYVGDVMRTHKLASEIVTRIERLMDSRLEIYFTCAIHGDATLDNLLMPLGTRDFTRLMVTDPLAPDYRIPNDKAVDLGKMLQSAYGWEIIKTAAAGRPKEELDRTPTAEIQAVLYDEDPEVAHRARVWCVIHLLRILPYAKGRCLYPDVVRLLFWAVADAEYYDDVKLAVGE